MAMPHLDTATIFVPQDADFPTDDSERQDGYLPANDIDELGTHLIATCPELAHLHTATINYVWKREGGKSGGKTTLGKCTALSGYARFLSQADFLIWLPGHHARELGMMTGQLEALTFHELLHCDVDEESAKPKVRRHDFEGFDAELRRYGTWTSELREAKSAFEQAPLQFGPTPFRGSA